TKYERVQETMYKDVQKTVYRTVSVPVPSWPLLYASTAGMLASPSGPLLTGTMLTASRRDKHRFQVDLATLTGPQVKSHPWQKMLAGRKPEISPLARCVPDDFYFAEFRSPSKLLEALEISDLWSTHLYNQANHEAQSQRVAARLQEQLAVQTSEVLR